MASNFTFNSIQKPYIRIIEMKRPYWSTVKRNISEVPKRIGGRLTKTDMEPLVIPVTVRIEADSKDQLLDRSEEMASWLITDDPKQLVFDDRPNRAYYAVVEGDAIPEMEIVSFSTLKINFICPDPYKYGQEKQAVRIKKLTWEDYKGQTWEEVAADGD